MQPMDQVRQGGELADVFSLAGPQVVDASSFCRGMGVGSEKSGEELWPSTADYTCRGAGVAANESSNWGDRGKRTRKKC